MIDNKIETHITRLNSLVKCGHYLYGIALYSMFPDKYMVDNGTLTISQHFDIYYINENVRLQKDSITKCVIVCFYHYINV